METFFMNLPGMSWTWESPTSGMKHLYRPSSDILTLESFSEMFPTFSSSVNSDVLPSYSGFFLLSSSTPSRHTKTNLGSRSGLVHSTVSSEALVAGSRWHGKTMSWPTAATTGRAGPTTRTWPKETTVNQLTMFLKISLVELNLSGPEPTMTFVRVWVVVLLFPLLFWSSPPCVSLQVDCVPALMCFTCHTCSLCSPCCLCQFVSVVPLSLVLCLHVPSPMVYFYLFFLLYFLVWTFFF